MKLLRGIPVSPGVAIGAAVVLDAEGDRIAERHVAPGQVAAEVARLRDALAFAAREARESQTAVADKLGRQVGDIFGAHAQLLEAPTVLREAETLIRDKLLAAESAVSRVIARYTTALATLGHDNRF